MTLYDRFKAELSHLEATNPLLGLFKTTGIYDFDSGEPPPKDLKNFIGVGKDVAAVDFLNTFKTTGLSHIIQISNSDLLYEIFIAAMITKRPRLFLKNPFTMLSSANQDADTKVRIWNQNFTQSDQKAEMLDSISKFMNFSSSLKRYKDNILIIADELITNSIYNGPCTEQGTPLFKGVPRNELVSYPGDKKGTVFICHTDVDLFIGCIDPWGSIDKKFILESLHRAYEKADVVPDARGGIGAGIGLRMILDRSRSLYIVTEHMTRTLVCGHVRLNESLKKVDSTPKQVHIQTFRVK